MEVGNEYKYFIRSVIIFLYEVYMYENESSSARNYYPHGWSELKLNFDVYSHYYMKRHVGSFIGRHLCLIYIL